MSDARGQVLNGIRRSLGRGPIDAATAALVDQRIADHPRNLVPARAVGGPGDLVARFIQQVEKVAATIDRVASVDMVPDRIADYLAGQNLPAAVKVAPDPMLDGIPWDRRPTLSVERGGADPADAVGVVAAIAGIAETGTLMVISGAGSPTRLNFLPDTHIIVLATAWVVGSYEDGWDRLRAAGPMPRTVNLITGPSRTGDIEQQIQLGAHGPRRLRVILIDDLNG